MPEHALSVLMYLNIYCVYGALADLVKEYDYPICFGFDVGHVSRNLPLINGANVTLDVTKNEVKLTFNINPE